MSRILSVLIVLGLFSIKTKAQETLPIYSDYLSDNVYLLHPAAAGVGFAGKFRVTNHTQWKGVENAPAFNTLSFHNRIGKKTGLGLILFNDKNGNNSQTGFQGTYAYHLNLTRYSNDFEQLSFGFSMTLVQNRFDRGIIIDGDTDLAIASIKSSDGYFNGDFGMAYHKNNFFSYLSIKNLFLTTTTSNQLDALNLRKFILTTGYYFGENYALQFEPSTTILYDPYFERTVLDLNLKVYKSMEYAKLWGALSFRKSFESSGLETLQYLSPIVGVNYRNFMFSYTYTDQLGSLGIVPKGGFHQLTLGFDLFVREPRLAACPNIVTGYN